MSDTEESGQVDFGTMLERGQIPGPVELCAIVAHEMSEGDDLNSDVWVAVAAAMLDDVHVFREAVRRNWRRDYEAQLRGASAASLGGRPSNERSAVRLAMCARAIVARLAEPLATQLAHRLNSYELTFG